MHPCNSYVDVQELSKREEMEETMFLGLRMIKGVSLQAFESLFGVSMEKVYSKVIDMHCTNGLLEVDAEAGEKYLRLTKRGLDISNYVMSDFLEPDFFDF